jgi:hypothetical protein
MVKMKMRTLERGHEDVSVGGWDVVGLGREDARVKTWRMLEDLVLKGYVREDVQVVCKEEA